MSQTEFDFNAPPKAESTAKPATAAILARIKKLLRLGTNPAAARGEAEAAMAMAYELAEKYRVDVGSLDLDDDTRRLMDERWPVGARYDTLRRGVFHILRAFFHVTTCLDRPEMLVIGKAVDLAIARYVHDFLLRAGRAALRGYEAEQKGLRRRMTTAKRTSFLQGFIYGVSARLDEAKESLQLSDAQSALVLAEDKEREARLDELVPRRKALPDRKARRNEGALVSGYRAGLDTHINQPLAGTPGAPLALQG